MTQLSNWNNLGICTIYKGQVFVPYVKINLKEGKDSRQKTTEVLRFKHVGKQSTYVFIK